jgi:hypothetical protein
MLEVLTGMAQTQRSLTTFVPGDRSRKIRVEVTYRAQAVAADGGLEAAIGIFAGLAYATWRHGRIDPEEYVLV